MYILTPSTLCVCVESKVRLATLELSCLLLKQSVLSGDHCIIKDVHLACLEVHVHTNMEASLIHKQSEVNYNVQWCQLWKIFLSKWQEIGGQWFKSNVLLQVWLLVALSASYTAGLDILYFPLISWCFWSYLNQLNATNDKGWFICDNFLYIKHYPVVRN